MNSFTKSLLAAAVAIAALASFGCKKDVPVEQTFNAEFLVNKNPYVYDVSDSTKNPEYDLCYPVQFIKDESDPNGNTVAVNWFVFCVCDKVTVTKTGTTLKLTTTPHDIEFLGSTINIKSFDGTYNLSTGDFSFTCSLKNSEESEYTNQVLKTNVTSTLELDKLKAVPYVTGGDDFKIESDGTFVFKTSTYSLTSSELIGTNEWILSKKSGSGEDFVRIKIRSDYKSILIGESRVNLMSTSTEYKLVTFSDFTNTNLTFGTTSNTVKFTPSTTKTNEGIFTSSASTDKQTYKITSSPNLYTYIGTMGDSSSLSGGKVGATDNMFKLVIKDSKTAELTLGSSKAITLTKK